MFIKTTSGYLNANDILNVQLSAGGTAAALFPIVAGHWAGTGEPYQPANPQERGKVNRLVAEWCDMGGGEYLNVKRFARVHFYGAAGERMVALYLADVAVTDDRGHTPFVYSERDADRIAAYLDGPAGQ